MINDIMGDYNRAVYYKDEGNKKYKDKDYNGAISWYLKGVQTCGSEYPGLAVVLLSNIAVAQYRLDKYGDALNYCLQARRINPNHVKAIVTGCRCFMQRQQYGSALTWCQQGLMIEENNKDLQELIEKALKCKQDVEDTLKKLERQKIRMQSNRKSLCEDLKDSFFHPGEYLTKQSSMLDMKMKDTKKDYAVVLLCCCLSYYFSTSYPYFVGFSLCPFLFCTGYLWMWYSRVKCPFERKFLPQKLKEDLYIYLGFCAPVVFIILVAKYMGDLGPHTAVVLLGGAAIFWNGVVHKALQMLKTLYAGKLKNIYHSHKELESNITRMDANLYSTKVNECLQLLGEFTNDTDIIRDQVKAAISIEKNLEKKITGLRYSLSF